MKEYRASNGSKVIELGGICELHSWLSTAESPMEAGACESQDNVIRPRASWDDGLGYGGAMEMASGGGYWPEGAEKIMDAKIEVDASAEEVFEVLPTPDVTGHTLDMDEYLAGEPECWIRDDDVPTEAPVITVGVNTGMLFDVDAQSMFNQGAAILSVVDRLESDGKRVRLMACEHSKAGDHKANVVITIKESSDEWSPSSVAFALCHPAFNRRLIGFRAIEVVEEWNPIASRAYGRGQTRSDIGDLYDVYIPLLQDDEPCATAKSALEYVKGIFEKEMGKAND